MSDTPVTQADWDAVKKHQQRFFTEGISESTLLAQAFANHRAQSEPSGEASQPQDELREALSVLSSLRAFVSVMIGSGPNCTIPETIPSPIGANVRIGKIMRDADATLAKQERGE